ncbi:Mannose-1-phosphate guanylyltransferase [Fimbriimonas ginsengisoli Gsoil 348]|uniref:Mannose-1-phosphate guanylyltransferase n=1 Tax=Fimbriimonas ginsengisoli Gsoil 348 TaxID=661478 RepID=A0A068NNI9_FIMGI|nr:Mannose-1-phosphate guanylyltransferase [Fimbriimonas ginsengisoli Gsoil 348]
MELKKARVGVVMAGGSGERFWPLSRPGRPKQLLCLTDPNVTMLEEAVRRVEPLFGVDGTYVATSTPLREAIIDCGVAPESLVLSEPARRNTLGAICWIVANLISRDLGDATVAILTADHLIGSPDTFRECLASAMDIAEREDGIVTLGVPPTRPETGYGYIEEGDHSSSAASNGRVARRAQSFREKPSEATAEEFLSSGRFLWNSGMFFFTVATFLAELIRTQPAAHLALLNMAGALRANDRDAARREFESLPNISVDYAVMERAERMFVLRADFPWDDVGAWDAMARTLPSDERGNVIQGNAVVEDSEDCVVINDEPGITVGVLGLRDLVVVATKDAVLVCPKSQAQRVRTISEAVSKRRTSGA